MTRFSSMYHQSTTMVLPTGSTLNMLSGTPSFSLAIAKSFGGWLSTCQPKVWVAVLTYLITHDPSTPMNTDAFFDIHEFGHVDSSLGVGVL